MSTVRDFITLALKEAGVIGIGQTPLSEDINDGFTLLNRMLYQWQRDRYIVPMLIEVVMPGNSLKSNKIGPGQYYNSLRPDKINAAYIVQLYPSTDERNLVSIPLTPIFSYEEYSLLAVKNLPSLPNYFFYDNAYPYGNVYIWPIPDYKYEIHLIVKGPIGFETGISTGEITNSFAGGASDGQTLNVDLIGGTGTNATADITVSGGVITAVGIANQGSGYNINDMLTIDLTDIGGTGTGFLYKITNVVSSLDTEFTMPPEYEEAIHYNLAIRICSMYKIPASQETVALARASLQGIRKANTQIFTLIMPAGLALRKSFNIYNADGY